MKEPSEPKIPSKEISFNLFQQGKTIDEIAAERGLVKSTILGHLTPYIKEGKIGLRSFISTSRENKIRTSFSFSSPYLQLSSPPLV